MNNRAIIAPTILFFVLLLVISLFWGLISQGRALFPALVPSRPLQDWRFDVALAMLFISWLSFSFLLPVESRKKFRANPLLWSFIAVLFLSVLALLLSFFYDLYSIKPDDPAIATLNKLERVPTDWRFYTITLALAGLWASWRFYLKLQLREMLDLTSRDSRRQGLNNRDWQAYRELRGRALSLRTRAGLALGGVLALLFAGIYLILFILPQIKASDQSFIRKIQRKHFERNFGAELKAIAEGRYWIKTYGVDSSGSQSRIFVAFSGLDKNLPISKRRINTAAANEKFGLIAGENGSIVATPDGGETWKPKKLELKPKEQIRTAKFSKDGKHALLIGDRGSTFLLLRLVNEMGEFSLSSKSLALKPKESNKTIAQINEGKHTLFVGSLGSIYLLSINEKGEISLSPKSFTLKENEQIGTTTVSNDDKRVLILGNEGSAFLLFVNEKGQISSSSTSSILKPKEQIQTTKVSNDAKHALIVGNEGSAILLSVNDKNVPSLNQTSFSLKTKERIRVATLSDNGKYALVLGHEGSAFLLSVNDHGKPSMRTTRLPPTPKEKILAARLSDDGQHAVVVGSRGSVILLSVDKQGDFSPKLKNLESEKRKPIISVRFINDGKHVLLLYLVGTLTLLSVNEKDAPILKTQSLTEKRSEWMRVRAYSSNNKHALLVGDEGTVVLLSFNERGEPILKPKNFTLKGRVRVVNFDSEHVLAVDSEGFVVLLSLNEKGEFSSESMKLKLKPRERLRKTMRIKNSKRILLVGDKYSIFLLSVNEKGKLFSKSANLELKAREQVQSITFSNDGLHALIASNTNSVFMTKDTGWNWKETKWDGPIPELASLVSVPLGKGAHVAVAIDVNGDAYLLKNHADIKEWKSWAFPELKKEISKNKIVKDSNIFEEINSFLADIGSLGSEKNTANPDNTKQSVDNKKDGNGSDDKPHQSFFGISLNNLTMMRIATMTVLFFLVQLLVRLYQYSMRLANFWDSRADAILLRQNFAENKAFSFDSLVQALAPDAYDFKPMPGSLFGLRLPRRDL